MQDLFRDFWWLVFPLAWIIGGGFSSLLNYRRQKQALELIRAYAEKGQEPPAALLALIGKPIDSDGALWEGAADGAPGKPANYWSLFGLFAALGAGFTGAHYYTDMDGGSGAFLIVGMVMGAVAVWAAISALTSRGGRR